MSVNMLKNYLPMTYSYHELQEVENDPATCFSGFGIKDSTIFSMIRQGSKKCMTGYIAVK